MKKLIAYMLMILMLLITISSAFGDIVTPQEFEELEVEQTNVISSFFGGVQQTVIASKRLITFGEVVTFDFLTTSELTTDRAIYVFELYRGEEPNLYLRLDGKSLVIQSPDEFSIKNGEIWSVKVAHYFSQDFYEVGAYRMVAYLYDRASGKLISANNDFAGFEITGVRLTDLQCSEQFENTCNGDIGFFSNCVSVGSTCNCVTNACDLRELCSNGICVPSSLCEPDIVNWESFCDASAKNDCGNTITRFREGQKCAVNSICKDEVCTKQCNGELVGNLYCKGNTVRQSLLKADCSTIEQVITECSSNELCDAGECIVAETTQEKTQQAEQELEDDGLKEGETVLIDNADLEKAEESKSTSPLVGDEGVDQNCVVDAECGVGFNCDAGECTVQEEAGTVAFAVVMIVIILIIAGLFGVNIFFSRRKNRGKK